MATLMRASVPLRTSLHSRTCRLLQNQSASTLKVSTIHTFITLHRPQPTSATSRSSSIPSQPLTRTLSQIAAFHTSRRRLILPPEPQVVDGTANDPAPVPKPEPGHGSYHWAFERIISAAILPLTIAPFAAGTLNPTMDAVLCATIIIHSHIGFESIIIDYLPKKRVPKTRALFWWGLRAGTIVVAIGLYEFETNDVGVTEAIKRIWTA